MTTTPPAPEALDLRTAVGMVPAVPSGALLYQLCIMEAYTEQYLDGQMSVEDFCRKAGELLR